MYIYFCQTYFELVSKAVSEFLFEIEMCSCEFVFDEENPQFRSFVNDEDVDFGNDVVVVLRRHCPITNAIIISIAITSQRASCDETVAATGNVASERADTVFHRGTGHWNEQKE
jgi:hypothetical protein